MSLISDDDEHSLGTFAAATDMNQLAGIEAIAVEYRVTHGFSSASSTNSSLPPTQRDRAIRLITQSTNGEIRPISLRSQVCTSSGAPELGLSNADCRDLKLPTQTISATSRRHSFAPFRKNNIVTAVVPLFRHAWRVPFCTTTSPRLR